MAAAVHQRLRWQGLAGLLLLALLALSASIALTHTGVMAQDQVDDEEEAYSTGDAVDEGTEVVATGEDAEEEEEEVPLLPASDVETVVIFPAFYKKSPVIRAGQKTELLFSISNTGKNPLKILGVQGRLFLTYDYRAIAQNLTGELPSNVTVVNATVPTGVQSSFAFHFTPDKMFQPREFGLAASVIYEVLGGGDGGAPALHASTLFNATIEIIEPAGVISGESVFLGMLGVGLLVLFGMWASSQLEALSKKAKRAKKVETGTQSSDEAEVATNEWLQGTFFYQKPSKSQAGKTRKRR